MGKTEGNSFHLSTFLVARRRRRFPSQSSCPSREAPGLKNDSTSVEKEKSTKEESVPGLEGDRLGRVHLPPPNDERLFSTFSGFQLKFQSAPMCLLFFFPVFRSDAFAARAKSSVNVNIYHFLQFLPRNLGSAVLCGS